MLQKVAAEAQLVAAGDGMAEVGFEQTVELNSLDTSFYGRAMAENGTADTIADVRVSREAVVDLYRSSTALAKLLGNVVKVFLGELDGLVVGQGFALSTLR